MLKQLFVIILFLGVLMSCETEPQNIEITGRGGVVYGGDFRFYSSEKVTSTFPFTSTDTYSNRVVSQLFQGLLRLNPDGTETEPCIASKYTTSEDAKKFTFTLRNDVYFHDNTCFSDGKGRLVVAEDFNYSIKKVCSNDNAISEFSWLLIDRIVGARDFYEGKISEISGVRVLSEHVLEIELLNPFAGFDKILTHPALSVIPHEAFEKYGDKIGVNPVGTGPFCLNKIDDDHVQLIRNANYWEIDEFGNKLPFLETISIQFNSKKIDELIAFRKGEIDLVMEIPVDEIENILGSLDEAKEGKNVKHKVATVNSLSIDYIGFAHKNSVFSDIRVRKAFNLALDRKSTVERVLSGEVIAAENGFVPYMTDYPIDQLNGQEFNVKKAKQLLAEAGYPEGRDFPVLDYYTNSLPSTVSYKMSEAVVAALKENLNITIALKSVSYKEREEAIKNGKAAMWRSGWLADYPDPENFLSIFAGADDVQVFTIINPFNYDNTRFTALFNDAKRETNLEKRMKLYADCDQLIIDDAVVVPLFHKDFITMVNLRAKRFSTNQMEHLDFTRVYIKELVAN
jgi:oligopeptide transport system substrate-binding protein